MSEEQPGSPRWYAVRCVFRTHDDATQMYEERVTLWRADDVDEAIAAAEEEAADHAETVASEYLGLAQAYWLPDPPDHGTEVFSLYRESDLKPPEYLDRFFDTGGERQQHWSPPGQASR